VVRHCVQDKPHAERFKVGNEIAKLLFGSDFRIESIVIGDVVAVGASRPGLQHCGSVAMTYAEGVQVGYEKARVLKSKFTIELQTIGGEWTIIMFA